MYSNTSVIGGDDLPVHSVSWQEACMFTSKLTCRVESYPAEVPWKGDLLEWCHDEYVNSVSGSDPENPTTAFNQVPCSCGYLDSFGYCYPFYYDLQDYGEARSNVPQMDGSFGFRLMHSSSLYSHSSSFVNGEQRAEDFDTNCTDFHEFKIED